MKPAPIPTRREYKSGQGKLPTNGPFGLDKDRAKLSLALDRAKVMAHRTRLVWNSLFGEHLEILSKILAEVAKVAVAIFRTTVIGIANEIYKNRIQLTILFWFLGSAYLGWYLIERSSNANYPLVKLPNELENKGVFGGIGLFFCAPLFTGMALYQLHEVWTKPALEKIKAGWNPTNKEFDL